MDGFIKIKCANWYENEDGCVRIMNSYGNTIFLNSLYSIVWKTIDSESEISVLTEALKNTVEKAELEAIINQLCNRNLAEACDSIDSFDLLF